MILIKDQYYHLNEKVTVNLIDNFCMICISLTRWLLVGLSKLEV
jgi:hypothetical protein